MFEKTAAESNHEKLRRVLDFFKKERWECIDDLPKERVVGEDNYHRYKCRTNWWQGVISNLRFLMEFVGVHDDRVEKEIESFIDFTKTMDWKKFRVKEEIDRANHILDVVINYLEQKVTNG